MPKKPEDEIGTEQAQAEPGQPEQPEQENTESEQEDVEIPFGDNPSETATLLLAAAEEAGLEASAVRTGSGVFVVSPDLAQRAGVEPKDDSAPQENSE